MSEEVERYRKVAAAFTRRVHAVPDDRWESPAPCEGWVARDVVDHLVAWMPSFFPPETGVVLSGGPSAADDPVAAWEALDRSIQRVLDDPHQAGREVPTAAGSTHTVTAAVDTFFTPDVLVHTWDLARAAGLDETLDPDEVHRTLIEMQPADELLRNSGHYGPRVEVPDDADEQTKLIAFTGRDPFAS